MFALAGVASGPMLSRVAHRRLVSTLERRFESRVALDQLSVQLFPLPHAEGQGLSLTPRSRPQDAPPLVTVHRFTVTAGYFGFFRAPVSVGHVTLEGAVISILPNEDEARHERKDEGRDAGHDTTHDAAERNSGDDLRVHVDRIEARGVRLILVPRKPDASPRVFDIEAVTLRSVSRDQPLAFNATLTNPVPRGTIVASGTFGPWFARDSGRTPVRGEFTFSADMGTIDGLRGTLEASGAFDGSLGRIGVRGKTSVPDFALSVAEHPVPLTTQFDATVDGTNGDTILNDVRAVLEKTDIACRGRVTDAPGRSGRVVQVDATIDGGRIEDLLRLAVRGNPPLMTGGVDVTTTLVIPPGRGDVIERMRLDAKVGIVSARFTAPAVQEKVNEFSARARKEADLAQGAKDGPPVASHMAVQARLRSGTLALMPIAFRVEGALGELRGSYGLTSEQIDLRGRALLDAKVSQLTTGWKSWVLKLADPLFSKEGGAASIPLSVSGTGTTQVRGGRQARGHAQAVKLTEPARRRPASSVRPPGRHVTRPRERQHDDERGASSLSLAARVDRPFVKLDQMLGDGQSKAQPRAAPRLRIARLAETLEDHRQQIGVRCRRRCLARSASPTVRPT